MIIALFGGDGRAVGTHAAVLLARASASVGTATTLLRIAGAHESRLPLLERVPDAMRVVERSGEEPYLEMVLHQVTETVSDNHLIVLDLPPTWLLSPPVDIIVHAGIMAIGPSALERIIATSTLCRVRDGKLPWLLACGDMSVGTFERAMRETMAAAGLPDASTRIISRGLPGPAQDDAARPGAGSDTPSIRAALGVLDVVVPDLVESHGPRSGTNTRMASGDGEADRRTPQERLRDLADALDAADRGNYPSADELASAPILEDWELGLRPVEALVGRVTGHSDIRSGRRVCTSEVYVSDRRTWARTYSRLYRLGRPAGPRPTLQ